MSSHRDLLAARERQSWIQAEEARQREAEDRQQYEHQYQATFRREMERTPPSLQIEPLPFEQWRAFMPSDEPDPVIRAAIATNKSLWQKMMRASQNAIGGRRLLDAELEAFNFDLTDRMTDLESSFVSVPALADIFRRFMAQTPDFDRDMHFRPVAEFITRNDLFPSVENLSRTFRLLLHLGLVEAKPEPPPQPAGTNKYGVNLQVQTDPEMERRKRQEEYRTKVVVTDPRTGQTFTAYQLDRADAETYCRLVIGEHHLPTMRDVLKVQQ